MQWVESGSAWMAHGKFADQAVTLAMPQLLMNRSGEALAHSNLVREADDLIVVHDEIDLPAGGIRVKVGGGTAGHRGVASVAAQYGTDFARVRVGVGRPTPGADVVEYVLGKFASDEELMMAASVQSAADAVECLVIDGRQAAMMRFNTQRKEAENAGSGVSAGDRERGEGA